jgi:dynein heavy chain
VSTKFPLSGVKYSRVCGKIKAYQYGTPDAFYPYYANRDVTIDNHYVDGVSLTHGQRPRKHIWTFATARDETRSSQWVCPCTKTNTFYTGVVPPFIGQDYFCETGSILI